MMSEKKDEPAKPRKPQSGSVNSRFKGLGFGQKRRQPAPRDNVVNATNGATNVEERTTPSGIAQNSLPQSVGRPISYSAASYSGYEAPQDQLAVVMRRSDRFSSAMDPPGRYQGEVARAEEWSRGMDDVDELRSGIPSSIAGEFSIHVLEAPPLVSASLESCLETDGEAVLDPEVTFDLSNRLNNTSIRQRSSVLDPRLFGSPGVDELIKAEAIEERLTSTGEAGETAGDDIQSSEIPSQHPTSKTQPRTAIPSKQESQLTTSAPAMAKRETTRGFSEVAHAIEMRQAPRGITPKKDSTKRRFKWVKKLF